MTVDVDTSSVVKGRKRLRWRGLLERRITGWTLIVLALLTWQWYATVNTVPQLPPLSAIAEEWWNQASGGDLLIALAETLESTLIGFGLATVVGTALGFLMGRVRAVWALLEPFVELVRQTPITGLFPLLILYLGIGDSLRITVVVLAATFPILLNTYAGAKSVTRTMYLTGRTFKLNWIQTQTQIAIPSALPFVLVGMRQALGLSLVISVVVGMLAGNSGIGYYILQAQIILNVTALFAGILSIALVGYVLNQVFLLADTRLTRWRKYISNG